VSPARPVGMNHHRLLLTSLALAVLLLAVAGWVAQAVRAPVRALA